jgi:hypothetical protein
VSVLDAIRDQNTEKSEGTAITTIAVRGGLIASDSQSTACSEAGGARLFKCIKLYRKFEGTAKEVILGTAGESFSSLLFCDWFGEGKKPPDRFLTGGADFTVIALTRDGLFEFDRWCRGEQILDDFYAIGSGAKAALGAMHMGATAEQAVEIACRIDPYSRPPVTVMSLSKLAE